MPFLIDSGAFSCWNRGAVIDLDEYIRFCDSHRVDGVYYVNLDIIPGKPNDVKSKTPSSIEAACQGGWDNYQKMLKTLPFEKVVPVFHQGDGIHWLEKYLKFGTPYIGISPANDMTTQQKLQWIQSLQGHLFDSAGNQTIHTHGFAVTSFKLMKCMKWTSVDSASWIRQAAYGTVYIPMAQRDGWRYDVSPFLLTTSPKSPTKDEREKHIFTLGPYVKSQVDRYLTEMRMPVGTFEVVEVPDGYKKQKKELWWEKGKKDKILRITKMGIVTCHQRRFYLNWKFLEKANEVLPVNYLYFAGAAGSLRDEIELKITNRLMSFAEIQTCKGAAKAFEAHMDLRR